MPVITAEKLFCAEGKIYMYDGLDDIRVDLGGQCYLSEAENSFLIEYE